MADVVKCPYCASLLSVDLAPAQVTPATLTPATMTPATLVPAVLTPAKLIPEQVVAARATGLHLVSPPPVVTPPVVPPVTPPVTPPVVPPVVPTATKVPFGPFSMPGATPPFTLTLTYVSPSTIVADIAQARAKGYKLILAMTGGSHGLYLTNGVFDPALWTAAMQKFDTPAIKAAIAAGVADGTILGCSMVDEPGNASWGGYFTKPKVDTLARWVKALFPTLQVGAVARWFWRTPTDPGSTGVDEHYKDLDFIGSQFIYRNNVTPETERDQALAMAKADGVDIVWSINALGGGSRLQGWTATNNFCPVGPDLTGGLGTNGNCRMTANQLRAAGTVFLKTGRPLLIWQDDPMLHLPDYQKAMADLAAVTAVPILPRRRAA